MSKYKKDISEAVIKRLPRYYHLLCELKENDIKKVSSDFISKQLKYTASKVRQDLSNFGEFGQQGYGYDVEYLQKQIENIIGLTKEYNMILVGYGNIGKALASYNGFMRDGFHIKAVFDIDITKSFEENGIQYLHENCMSEYVKNHNVDIAIIATPKVAAQKVAEAIISFGIKAIWNFAPTEIACPEYVNVENMNMSESLYTLCYRYNN